MFPVVLSHATHHTIGARTCGGPNLNPATKKLSAQQRFKGLPQTTQLLWAGGIAMLLLTVCNWLLEDRGVDEAYLDHYGGMVAEQVARLSKDAMVRSDAIALNVLAEQVASDPAIGAVTVYSMDGRTLASYGSAATNGGKRDSATREFNRPIQLEDATAGFVRITLDPEALTPASHSGVEKALAASRPLAALLLASLALWVAVRALTRHPKPTNDQRAESPEHYVKQRAIVLTARLFNSDEMSGQRREASLQAAEARVTVVAELYGANHERFEDSAIAVVFMEDTNSDQRFHAACAALVIARLCNQPGGARYRYALQEVELPDQQQMTDALLYAALANDNTITVSSSYARALERPERLQLTCEHSPALANLQGKPASDYYLLSGANATTEDLLDRQIEKLLDA